MAVVDEGFPLPTEERVAYLIDSYVGQIGVVETPDGAILIDDGPIPVYQPDTGALVGYEMFVRSFTAEGDLGVDPHRVFINPPDGRRQQSDGTVIEDVPPVTVVDDILIQTVTP